MAVRKDTIFERFLGPVMRVFLDEAEMRRLHESIDWERAIAQFQRDLEYPSYYISQNFHGIEGGYLTADAAVSYDPITQYVLPPNETLVRQGAIDAISGQPRRILDLGCGTGSMTLMLQQAFPEAEVIGLDLSPYMLCIAQRKAQAAGLEIQWVHGNAEKTDFPDAAFDLVTASLLYHETPPRVAQAIARESFRLLKTGGEFIVFDGNQKTLRHTEWLTDIFEEPYIRDYAKGSVDAWMGAAGFGAVRTEDHWWVNQVTRGVKPIANSAPEEPPSTAEWVQQPSFA